MSTSVCMYVYLPACLYFRFRVLRTMQPIFTNFLCVLPMAVAMSSSDVLLVLWMTSWFHTIGSVVRQRRARNGIDSRQILLNVKEKTPAHTGRNLLSIRLPSSWFLFLSERICRILQGLSNVDEVHEQTALYMISARSVAKVAASTLDPRGHELKN